jgi:hypothetical protein
VPGYDVASWSSVAAPDVGTLAAPQALLQTGPATWVTYAGGNLSPAGLFAPGGFSSDGGFFIPDVPASGPYLLSFDDAAGVRWLVETNAAAVDLGYDQLGRSGLAPAGAGTALTFNLSGLYPWSADWSELQLTSSGAGLWTGVPTQGSIARGASTGFASLLWGVALDSADVLWLHQLAKVLHSDGFSYRSAIRAGSTTGAGYVDGATTTFDVAMRWVPQLGSLPVQWSPSDFEAHLASMAPASRQAPGVIAPHRLSVRASPYALQAPAPLPAGGLPELATLELPLGAGPLSPSAPLRYGRFLPASWLELREVRFATAVAYQAPGANDQLYEVSAVGMREQLPAASAVLTPALTPVQQLTINGAPALADQAAAVTSTPTFSWVPPALGSPSHYVLELVQLGAPQGVTVRTLVARYLTRATQVTLPIGTLTSGALYFARVTAVASSEPFDTAPLRQSPIAAFADSLTGTFMP